MNLGDILNNSFDYAKKLFSNIGRLVILIILDIIPIVNLIVIGYFAKAVRESPASNDVPKLEGYGNMFMQGLKVAVAVFLYMIIPMILIITGAAFLGTSWMMIGVISETGMWSFSPLGIILIIVGIAVTFFIAIIAATGIVHMIKLNSFGKAFALSEIMRTIGKIGWGKYIGWLIVMFILGMIVGWLGAIHYIGWLISLIISPVYGIFAARSAALIYAESAPQTQYPPPSPTPTPTPSALFCKSCGALASPGAIYCQNCGQKLQ